MIFPLRGCPAPWEITRAASEGLSVSLQDHLTQCADCRARYESEQDISSLAPALSRQGVSVQRRQDTKQQLLQALSQQAPAIAPRRWPQWVALAASVVFLAGGAYWLLLAQTPPNKPLEERRGVIFANDKAVFTQEGAPGQERVAMVEGNALIEVKRLQPNERFIVATRDAEVEVHGTRFEVFASAGELEAVQVFEGTVEVRYLQNPSVFLSPGERWTRPTEPTSAPTPPQSQPSSAASSPAVEEPAPASKPNQASPTEAAFADGFALMREERFTEAALSFGRAAKGRGSLQEDALFWQAIALGRAEQATEARSALESFLLRYPSSPRAGEAALALGWLLFDAKDLNGAKRWFHVAERDPSETVKQRAEEALQQLPAE